MSLCERLSLQRSLGDGDDNGGESFFQRAETPAFDTTLSNTVTHDLVTRDSFALRSSVDGVSFVDWRAGDKWSGAF